MVAKRKTKKRKYSVHHDQDDIRRQVDRAQPGGALQNARVAAMAMRSDGYMFYAIRNGKNELRIWAGCQHNKTVTEYKQHVRTYYPNIYGIKRICRAKQKETLALLDFLVLSANATWSA